MIPSPAVFSDTCARRLLVLAAMVMLCATLTSCRTYGRKTESIHAAFYRNDLSSASAELAAMRKKKENRKNENLLKLEESVTLLCLGDFKQSETLLREVRDRFDTLENRKVASAAETAASMLSDDLTLTYPGEDHEKVLLRAMLAISNLMQDGQEVIPYSHQINMKQEEIIRSGTPMSGGDGKIADPKKSYKYLALGPYLTGMIHEERVTGMSEATRAYEKVRLWEPKFTAVEQDLLRAQTSTHTRKGNGAVYVITLLGSGPRKMQTSAPATQLALLIADRIVSATSKHSVPPTIAPVPVAEIVETPCRFHYVNVSDAENQSYVVSTQTITDVNRIARQQFEANRDWIIARAVARRVIKKAAVYGAKEALDVRSSGGEILLNVAGVLWEATEEADTRCWSLLPGKIQIARLELPTGTRELVFQPVGSQASLKYTKTINVRDGRNTYVLAYIADDGLIGDIQCSDSH